MSNPFVYYRLDSIKELKHDAACTVRDLDWHKDLAVIQKYYARFTDAPINPDEFDQTVGSPSAIMDENGIISFAIPLSFREGETEIGAVATVPEQRNKKILDGVKALAYRPLIDILRDLDPDFVRASIAGKKFSELFYPNCKDQEIADFLKSIG